MNIDFGADPAFSWYVVLLLLSGIAMLGLGAANAGRQSFGWRLLNLAAGLGFIGYGVYLGFIFQGGDYVMFFQAFILPVVLIARFARSAMARRRVTTGSM